MTDAPILYVPGPPEILFGIGDVAGTSASTVSDMTPAAWMVGSDGWLRPGALGVLIDTGVGSASVAHRPPAGWAVTTDLTITFCSPVPADCRRLVSRARSVSADVGSSVAQGTVERSDGTVVALVHERVEFTATAPIERTTEWDRRSGVQLRSDGVATVLDVVDPVVNPGGSLHGGIAIYVSELVAADAVDALVPGLVATGLQITYLRRAPLDEALRFVTEVEHQGRTWAAVAVEATDSAGRVCTHARITYRRPHDVGPIHRTRGDQR